MNEVNISLMETFRRGASIALLVALAAALASCPAMAQTFGQFTTAGVAADGEGGFFMTAGDDVMNAGVMARFRITPKSDLGFQGGFESFHDVNSLGIGADFKYYLLSGETTLPVDLAAGASLGEIFSDDFGRTILGFSLIASGRLLADTSIPLEPYGSAGFYTAFFHDGSFSGDSTDSDVVVRGGLNLDLRDDLQFMLEVKIDGTTTFGAALNLIF